LEYPAYNLKGVKQVVNILSIIAIKFNAQSSSVIHIMGENVLRRKHAQKTIFGIANACAHMETSIERIQCTRQIFTHLWVNLIFSLYQSWMPGQETLKQVMVARNFGS